MTGLITYKKALSGKPAFIITAILLVLILACEKNPEGAGLTDIDGNVYDTVVIGTQVWMAENLRTTRLNDGTQIPLVESDTAWNNLKTPGYCWYGNYEAFFSLNNYGALYNFYAVSTGNLCPVGWHVPSTDEWYVLKNYLGFETAGGSMKEAGTRNWLSPNTGATNESGFNALPGGYRNTYYEHFQRFRLAGYFWHSDRADAMGVNNQWFDLTHYSMGPNSGVSVRCIKD